MVGGKRSARARKKQRSKPLSPSRRIPKTGFLTGYSVEDKLLVSADRASGRAGIMRARDPDAKDVLIKYWPRVKGADDSDLEEIWRSEIRQLQRLAAVPRADDLFVHMITSGKDKDAFYLVLDPAAGTPLDLFHRPDRKPDLLAQARQPRTRRILWANARRLAEALELLHSQGVIHRNLDPWAVVTALTPEPDFRITGFEWSMRIVAADAKVGRKIRAPRDDKSFSFARDWRDLALLFALFQDIPAGPLGDTKFPPSRVADHASAAEIRLLRAMLGLEPVERLDGNFVCTRIDEIIDSIAAEAAGQEAKTCLAVRLGPDSRLAAAVRRASNNEIEIDDEELQLQFVKDDIGAQAQLVGLNDLNTGVTNYVLLGRMLTYRLAPYRQPGSTEAGNWEFAQCDRADSDPPSPAAVLGDTLLDTGSLEVSLRRDAIQSFPRRRGKVLRWDDYIKRTAKTRGPKSDLERMHQSFALLLVLEMAFAAADIFPIQIISSKSGPTGEQQLIQVVSRNDADRAKLSQLLGVEAPAERLIKILDSDEVREEGLWMLSEPGMLGERSTATTNWRFVENSEVDGIPCLTFEGTAPPHQRTLGFLAPPGIGGRIAQFKRRVKALTALKDHAELLRMLVDPRNALKESQDLLDETSPSFKRLDPSKQDALREIISTVPIFLLQGPPGVGKTYLVGDVVRRRWDNETTTRMLLSAQSNSAIDHLMDEVQSVFDDVAAEEQPLIVRARSLDDDDSVGEFEIDYQADKLLQDLAASDLAEEASEHLRSRIIALADARSGAGKEDSDTSRNVRRISAEVRALEGIILRAANFVFATTNSAAVERLIEERGLFDWSIIEEAGKATGGELLSPLLLSNRRLMIGDHKQLPPFDLDKLSKLLSLTDNVRQTVLLVDDLISRYLRDPGVDDVFREVETAGDAFGSACADTMLIVTLFETWVEREFLRQRRARKGAPIARRLSEQYRMHPAIARIVSECFYDGGLSTNSKKAKSFFETPSPVISSNPRVIPDLPIVFIDIPFGREEAPGGRSTDQEPPWSNRLEIVASIKVLESLRVRAGAPIPSLAVLSPYLQQVNGIRNRLERNRDCRLAHLSGFKPAIGEGEFCGTVDSFQGGEADAVIISLVRNNHHTTPARALGFLRDNRRMNVLLSRAKWRLVLIGSLPFYRNTVELSAKVADHDIGFLGKFLTSLDEAVASGDASIVPLRNLEGRR